MGLDTVLTALANAVSNACNAAGILQGAATFKGWPTSTQLVELLGQPNTKYVVSLFPFPARNVTRWLDTDADYTPPNVTLDATISPADTVTFALSSGATMGANYNVHAFIKTVNADILVQPLTTDTPANLATALAAAVNGLALPGITAAVVGNGVVLTGGQWEFCNVGGTGTYRYESTRVGRPLQVTVWTTGDVANVVDPDRSLRLAVYDAILGQVGTKRNHFYYDASDGTPIFLLYSGDDLDDESQSSYSLYASRMLFEMEYSANVSLPATQVGAFQLQRQINQNPPTTLYRGG